MSKFNLQSDVKAELIEKQARYLIINKATVRETAKYFTKSKTTVHYNLRDKLPQINPELYREVAEVLDYNKSVRHIRGGETTKSMWKKTDSADEPIIMEAIK